MRQETKVCPICSIEKPYTDYNKYKRKCKDCEHLCRCYLCKGIKDSSEFREGLRRCKPCDNKFHEELRKIKPKTESYREKVKRGNIAKKARGYKAPITTYSVTVRRIRGAVKNTLKSWSIYKTQKSFNYLGYTKEEFLNKFPQIPEGMDLDHKIPISWFAIDSPLYVIHSLDNLQILTKEENCSKKNYYAHPVSQEYYNKALPHIKVEYINKLSMN